MPDKFEITGGGPSGVGGRRVSPVRKVKHIACFTASLDQSEEMIGTRASPQA